MQKNVSENEARVRTVIAAILVLVALFLVENSTAQIVMALVAAILAGTAFLNVCPMRSLCSKKNSTCSTEPDAGAAANESPVTVPDEAAAPAKDESEKAR